MCIVQFAGVAGLLYSIQVCHGYCMCRCAGSTVHFSDVQFVLLDEHVYTMQRPPFSVHVNSLYCSLCMFAL